jgi:hypothetical protein
MAKGDEIGSFELKMTTSTLAVEASGIPVQSTNYEGTFTTGDGTDTLLLTARFWGHSSGGSYAMTSLFYAPDGTTIFGTGQGNFASSGVHCWTTIGIGEDSAGARWMAEGEMELATRTWNGKLFALV